MKKYVKFNKKYMKTISNRRLLNHKKTLTLFLANRTNWSHKDWERMRDLAFVALKDIDNTIKQRKKRG